MFKQSHMAILGAGLLLYHPFHWVPDGNHYVTMSTNFNLADFTNFDDDPTMFTEFDDTVAPDEVVEFNDTVAPDGVVAQGDLDIFLRSLLPFNSEAQASSQFHTSGAEVGFGSSALAPALYKLNDVSAYFIDNTGHILPVGRPVSKRLH